MAGRHGAGGRTYNEVPSIPEDFPRYMREGVHSGRGTGHQIAMTNSIVPALVAHPRMQKLIADDKVAYFAGAKHGRRMRNQDLVFGVPAEGAIYDGSVGMLRGIPKRVVAAGEYKSIMTELGKNAGNRRDDLRQHKRHARRLGDDVLAFGVCPINAADEYFSATFKDFRKVRPDGVTAAAKAVDTMREAITGDTEDRLDLLWTPVIEANNHPDEKLRAARWLPGYPQPTDGDEMSWGHFIEQLATGIYKRLKD